MRDEGKEDELHITKSSAACYKIISSFHTKWVFFDPRFL